MSIGDLQILELTRTLLDELSQRWVMPQTSAAYVEHSARKVRDVLCLCGCATALAFCNERVISPDVLGELDTGGAK